MLLLLVRWLCVALQPKPDTKPIRPSKPQPVSSRFFPNRPATHQPERMRKWDSTKCGTNYRPSDRPTVLYYVCSSAPVCALVLMGTYFALSLHFSQKRIRIPTFMHTHTHRQSETPLKRCGLPHANAVLINFSRLHSTAFSAVAKWAHDGGYRARAKYVPCRLAASSCLWVDCFIELVGVATKKETLKG